MRSTDTVVDNHCIGAVMNAVAACITVVYPAPQDVLLLVQTRRTRTSVVQSVSGARQDVATTDKKQYVQIIVSDQ